MMELTSNQVNLASFVSRLGAYLIDTIVLSLIVSVLATFNVFSVTNQTAYMTVTLAIGTIYFSVLHSSKWQATIGKRLFGLKVSTLDGEKVHFTRAFSRYFIMIFLSSLFYIGYLMIFFTKRKQALHDLFAKTIVISAK